MVNLKQERATASLRMLEFVAKKLGPLNEQVIYLGGCTTALFITDPLSLDIRPTRDVDCIVDIVSLSKYYQFGEKLVNQGFKQSIDESVICRWYYDDIILDVMPTDENILKFGNRWYKEAIKHTITHQLSEDIITIVAGRTEIVDEIVFSKENLKMHLKRFFAQIINEENFQTALPGHLK